MKAHIVGGGFGGLAAAGYLIKNAGMPGPDITIYEADEEMGGSFSLGGNAQSGYILPSGSVFDAEFRCTFDLLKDVPSSEKPELSVTDHFLDFNKKNPFDNRGRLIDRNGQKVHGPRFGLSLGDGLALARLTLKSEEKLEGRRIREFFSPSFFKSEFWLIYSTIMGVAAAAQCNGAAPLPEPHPAPFPEPFGHGADPAHAGQPERGLHRAAGRLAEGQRRQPAQPHLRARRRLRGDAGNHREPSRYRAERQRDLDRGRARRSRAADLRIAGRGSFDRVDAPGAAAADRRTVLESVEAAGTGTPGLRQSGCVLRQAAHLGFPLGELHRHHDRHRVHRSAGEDHQQQDGIWRTGQPD